MLRALGEQALHEFKAERDGGCDQFRIIVGGKGIAAAGEGISQLVDCYFFDLSRRGGEPGREAIPSSVIV